MSIPVEKLAFVFYNRFMTIYRFGSSMWILDIEEDRVRTAFEECRKLTQRQIEESPDLKDKKFRVELREHLPPLVNFDFLSEHPGQRRVVVEAYVFIEEE
jgi:hypothetical protein